MADLRLRVCPLEGNGSGINMLSKVNDTDSTNLSADCSFASIYFIGEPAIYPELVRRAFKEADFENVPEELIHRFASNTTISVRELEGLCISHFANEYLKRVGIKYQ